MSFNTARSIGLRYTFSKRNSGFLSFVSLFAIGGMALGVFALVVVLSVMNGFDRELKERILRAVPHGFIAQDTGVEDWQAVQAQIEQQPKLLASSPFIGGNVLLSYHSGVRGAELQGVAPALESKVSPVADYFIAGDMASLKAGEFGIVLGSILANSMGAYIGDKVIVTLPKVSVTLAGAFPRSRAFTVVGLFEVGAQVDQSLAIIHIEDAAKLYRSGDAVDGLRVRFEDLYQAPSGMQALEAQLGTSFQAVDWSQTQGSLFRAVKLEKTVTGILLSIIIAVAAFNIVTSLIMMVTDKRSDIAVLRTMGMNREAIMLVFITQGSVSAFSGIAIGLLLGIPAAIFLPELVKMIQAAFGVQVFDPSVYFVSEIPSLWKLNDTLVVAGFAVISSVLATLYPAYRATLIEPAEALRYDV